MSFAGLTKRAAVAIGAAALLMFLATAPAFGQTPPAPEKKTVDWETIDLGGIILDLDDEIVQLQNKAAQPSPDLEKLRAQLKELEANLQKKLAESQKLRADIEAAKQKMKTEEAGAKEKEKIAGRVVLRLDDGTGSDEIILRKVDGKWTIVAPGTKPGAKSVQGLSRVVSPPAPKAPTAPKAPAGAKQPLPPGSPSPASNWTPEGKQGKPEGDKRIDELEKKVDKLMELLEKMRKDVDGSRKKAEEQTKQARELVTTLVPLQAQEKLLLENHGPDHPDVKAIRAKIQAYRDVLSKDVLEQIAPKAELPR